MNYIFENASSQTKLKNKRVLFLSTKQSYNKVSIQLEEAGYLSPIVKEYIYIYIVIVSIVFQVTSMYALQLGGV